MRRAILVVVALGVLAGGISLGSQAPPSGQGTGGRGGGQAPPVATGTGLILGTVVDAASGRPVPGALVSLGSRGVPQPPVAAGAGGQFLFRDLPPGSYSLMVTKNGYLDSAAGRRTPTGPVRPIELRDGERVGDVVLRLWRHAVLSGTVIDDRGEPVAGLRVDLLRRALSDGNWTLFANNSTTSDDRGAYRFAKIEPGQYVLAARQDQDSFLQSAMTAMAADLPALMSLVTSAMAGGMQLPEIDFRARVVALAFAPGVATAEEAATFRLAPGDERTDIEIRVARVPTYRVSGTVTGPETMPNISVQLTSPALRGQTVGINLGELNRGGGFDFLGVPPGRYELRAFFGPPRGAARGGGIPPAPTGPTWWAVQPVTITDRDETSLVLTLRQGVRITGRLQFEGGATPAAFERFGVGVRAAVEYGTDWRTNTPGPVGVSSDGTFSTAGLPPGRYILRLSNTSEPWRLKSVLVGGKDATDLPIDVDSDVNEVVITVSDRAPSSLSGAVRNARGEPDTTAVVYVFPVDRQFWVNLSPAALRFKTTQAAANGRFSLSGFPEGEYFVLAAGEDRLIDWLQPKMLETMATQATRVQLGDSESRTVDLVRSDR